MHETMAVANSRGTCLARCLLPTSSATAEAKPYPILIGSRVQLCRRYIDAQCCIVAASQMGTACTRSPASAIAAGQLSFFRHMFLDAVA